MSVATSTDRPYSKWYWTPTETAAAIRRLTTGKPKPFRAVYIATPPAISGEWLLKLRESAELVAYVDKPWFGPLGLMDALRIAPLINDSLVTYRCLDHYLEKAAMRFLLISGIRALLGDRIHHVTGRLLEPARTASPAMGQAGAILDLLVHLVSILRAAFPGCDIEIQETRLGRSNDWSHPTECYVRTWGTIIGPNFKTTFDLAAGKHCPDTVKYMAIDGPQGDSLKINFVDDTIGLEHSGRNKQVFPFQGADTEPAYRHIVRRMADADSTLGMSPEMAISVLRILDDVRNRATSGSIVNFADYPDWMPEET